jgi:hypothetical protein
MRIVEIENKKTKLTRILEETVALSVAFIPPFGVFWYFRTDPRTMLSGAILALIWLVVGSYIPLFLWRRYRSGKIETSKSEARGCCYGELEILRRFVPVSKRKIPVHNFLPQAGGPQNRSFEREVTCWCLLQPPHNQAVTAEAGWEECRRDDRLDAKG